MARCSGQVKINRQKLPPGRSSIWAAIRFLKVFTLEDVVVVSEQDCSHVRKYVQRLLATDYLRLLRQATGQPGTRNRYRLIRDTGPKAPMPRRQSDLVYDLNRQKTFAPNTRKRSDRDLAWALIRQVEEVSACDLSSRLGMNLRSARKFLRLLELAGYVRVNRPFIPGPLGQFATYRLVKDSGPLTPVFRRTGEVFDPNCNRPKPFPTSLVCEFVCDSLPAELPAFVTVESRITEPGYHCTLPWSVNQLAAPQDFDPTDELIAHLEAIGFEAITDLEWRSVDEMTK